MIAAAHLRHRITVQQPATGKDAWGQPNAGWTDVATVSADIRPVSVREKMRFGALESELSHTVLVRWQAAFAGYTAADGWRVVFGSRTFRITGAHTPDEARVAVIFNCVEV